MIQSVGSGVQTTPRSALQGASAARAESQSQRPSDAVEFSDAALEADTSAPIRTELVKRVKAEIAAGSYLTDQKLNVAIERLQRYLNG